MPVVVVVTDAHALAPSRSSKACFGGHVVESQPAEIAIQVAGRSIRSARRPVNRRSVGDEDVDASVVVVVEQRDAGARRLEDVSLAVFRSRDVDGSESRLFREIREGDRNGSERGVHASHRLGRTVRAGHALEGVKASPEAEQDDGAGQETRDGSLPTGESHRDGPRGIRTWPLRRINQTTRHAHTIYHPRNRKLCQPGQRIEER